MRNTANRILASAAGILLIGAAPPPVTFTDYASDFDRIETATRDQPIARRVAAIRTAFARIRPGLYADPDPAALDRRIATALTGFPAIRARYRTVVRAFPVALKQAVGRFRAVFPGFVPPMPIILAHELGVRDGGSDYVAGQKVMLFGADVIARIHDDAALQPFLDHELFHLEHTRHFADCDQFWCPLWQEGLATDAARVMTIGATDHQLMLDLPRPIRAPTDTRWAQALCLVSANFDATDPDTTGTAFLGNRHPPGLPPRFGYYVGLRIAEEAERQQPIQRLAALSDEAARPVVAAALTQLLRDAQAPCAPPAAAGPITRAAPRPA